MRTAVLAMVTGEATMPPFRLQVHLVAARYGQRPDQVREWPADDFLEAVAVLPATGIVTTHVRTRDG